MHNSLQYYLSSNKLTHVFLIDNNEQNNEYVLDIADVCM